MANIRIEDLKDKGVHRRWLNIVTFDFEYKAQRYDANAFHLGCEFITYL